MLMLRLYLNIGILYEDNRDYQKAYDYFVKWHETCQEVGAVCLAFKMASRGRKGKHVCLVRCILAC